VIKSLAFGQFEESLNMVKELIKLDMKYYQNPPRIDEQATVRGLRGAAAVLVVASFENFLRQAIEEYLTSLSSKHDKLSFDKLPEKLRVSHVYNALDRAMKGPPFQEAPPKIQRLPEIVRACRIIIDGNIDSKVFSDTGGNPNSKNIRSMLSSVGLNDFFKKIKNSFDKRWKAPTSSSFIADKLDEIVGRRHIVAHTADALNISRDDLKESLRFMQVLARLLDIELARHIKQLIKQCS